MVLTPKDNRKYTMNPSREDAVTGADIVVSIIAVIGVLFVVHVLLGSPLTANHDEGIIPNAVEASADALISDGNVYGFADNGGPYEGITVAEGPTSPKTMGAVSLSLRLMGGEMGGVDMETADVRISSKEHIEGLRYSGNMPLERPNWTVASRSHVTAGEQADNDLIIEPGEIFTILVYPSVGLPPETAFSVQIQAGKGEPFIITRKVPGTIKPVMDLNSL
jgi:archaellin